MIFGNTSKDYKKGDFTVIPKNYPHTTNSVPGTLSHWEYLFIDDQGLFEKKYEEEFKHKSKRKIFKSVNKGTLFFDQDQYPYLAHSILELMEILRRQDVLCKEEAEAVLSSVLIKIAKINQNAEEKDEEVESYKVLESNSGIVRQVVEYINKHYMEDLPVEDLAKYCNISETHLRRLFVQNTKMKIHEYVNLVRIQQSCELLRRTDQNILDIAHKCGFPTISTFNRNFKQIVGESPCTWRKRPENYEQKLLKCNIHSENGW